MSNLHDRRAPRRGKQLKIQGDSVGSEMSVKASVRTSDTVDATSVSIAVGVRPAHDQRTRGFRTHQLATFIDPSHRAPIHKGERSLIAAAKIFVP